MDAGRALELQNRAMIAFDLALGTGALVAAGAPKPAMALAFGRRARG